MTATVTEKAQWDGHRKFTFYSKAKLKKETESTTFHPLSRLPFSLSMKTKMTPDSSRSSMSSNTEPAGIKPSCNLSCHNVLFLRYFKKNCDSGWCRNGASFEFLKISTSVDPRRNLAPTKSSLSDIKGQRKLLPLVSTWGATDKQWKLRWGHGWEEQRTNPLPPWSQPLCTHSMAHPWDSQGQICSAPGPQEKDVQLGLRHRLC